MDYVITFGAGLGVGIGFGGWLTWTYAKKLIARAHAIAGMAAQRLGRIDG